MEENKPQKETVSKADAKKNETESKTQTLKDTKTKAFSTEFNPGINSLKNRFPNTLNLTDISQRNNSKAITLLEEMAEGSPLHLTKSFADIPIRTFTKENYAQWPHIDYGISTITQQLNLQDEITGLKKKMADLIKSSEVDKADKKKIATDFKLLQSELLVKEKINHIIPRICEAGRELLFKSDAFKALFADARSCQSVVVSIDIRRSTELMLKARKPELFAKFITELTQKLSSIIISNYGVFDKFTGDGILAFFPDFYSGKNSLYFALKAAEECHQAFREHYNNSRSCFNVFIKDAGLGIGVDYGQVTLVNTNNELTVVGIPVVYACRMSGAKAGDTILNQPALELAEELYSTQIKVIETEINIKNEGTAVAYKLEINEKGLTIGKPDWQELIKEYGPPVDIPKVTTRKKQIIKKAKKNIKK